MNETINRNHRNLALLGWMTGLLSIVFLLAFQFTSERVDNYYYLGAFFTSLNIAVLCLCFSQVFKLLGAILTQLDSNSGKS